MDPIKALSSVIGEENVQKLDEFVEGAVKVLDQADKNTMIDGMGLGDEVSSLTQMIHKIDDTMDGMQGVSKVQGTMDKIEDAVSGFFGGGKDKDEDEKEDERKEDE